MSDELVDIGPNEDELRLQEEVAKARALEASSNKKRTTRFVLLSRSLSLNAATLTSTMVESLTLKTFQLDQL